MMKPRDTATITRKTLFVPASDDPAEAVAEFRTDLRPCERLAFDIETNGLDLGDPRGRVRSIQIGTPRIALLLSPENPRHVTAARELLADQSRRLTAHNAGFDIGWLHHIGIITNPAEVWNRADDTFILVSMLAPPEQDRTRYRDLKAQAIAWCGVNAVSADAKSNLKARFDEEEWKGLAAGWEAYATQPSDADPLQRNGWASIPRDDADFVTYTAADVFDGAQLAEVLVPLTEALWPGRAAVEHRAARLASQMQIRGIRIDKSYTQARLDEAMGDKADATKRLAKFGLANPGSSKALAAALGRLGVELIRTEKGSPATDDAHLTKYVEQVPEAEPFIAALRDYRDAVNRAGFAWRFLRSGGERIHATIATMTARTGRMSVKSPGLQNLPSTGGLRGCLIADPGTVLISSDFDSVEMCVAAAVTRDAKLLWMYTAPLADGEDPRGRDPYWVVAWQIFGPDATKADRKKVKMLVLGRMYGGGVATLAPNIGISMDLGLRIVRKMDETYPALKTWAREHIQPHIEAGRSGWLLDGGRWQCIDPSRSFAALNMIIQGTARELLLRAMFNIEDAGLAGHMLLPIHDEILFQVPEAEAEEYAERIQAAMNFEFRGVPITSTPEIIGPRWKKDDDDRAPVRAAPGDGVEPAEPQRPETPDTADTPVTLDPSVWDDPTFYLVVESDGGARGKGGRGPVGCGAVVKTCHGDVLAELHEYLGQGTGAGGLTMNVAEYRGALLGARKAVELGAKRVMFRADSELMVTHMSGQAECRAQNLRPLCDEFRAVLSGAGVDAKFRHIPREQNKHADSLANEAMDEGTTQ